MPGISTLFIRRVDAELRAVVNTGDSCTMLRRTAARGIEKICCPLNVSVQVFVRSSSVALESISRASDDVLVEGVEQFLARRGANGFSRR